MFIRFSRIPWSTVYTFINYYLIRCSIYANESQICHLNAWSVHKLCLLTFSVSPWQYIRWHCTHDNKQTQLLLFTVTESLILWHGKSHKSTGIDFSSYASHWGIFTRKYTASNWLTNENSAIVSCACIIIEVKRWYAGRYKPCSV